MKRMNRGVFVSIMAVIAGIGSIVASTTGIANAMISEKANSARINGYIAGRVIERDSIQAAGRALRIAGAATKIGREIDIDRIAPGNSARNATVIGRIAAISKSRIIDNTTLIQIANSSTHTRSI